MEIAVAVGCVGVLFIFGLIHAVCASYRALNELFSFNVEYNDEIYVKDDEDEAKVRKHQAIRMIEKKKAAEKFYHTWHVQASEECQHPGIYLYVNNKMQIICGKCNKSVPYVMDAGDVKIIRGGRG